jgi:hypothetical protein
MGGFSIVAEEEPMDVRKLVGLLWGERASGGFEIGWVGKQLVRHWRFRCLEIARDA